MVIGVMASLVCQQSSMQALQSTILGLTSNPQIHLNSNNYMDPLERGKYYWHCPFCSCISADLWILSSSHDVYVKHLPGGSHVISRR